jgi:Tfp pilus assembly protein FimT
VSTCPHSHRAAHAGATLTELIVVLTLVAVLMGIALPSLKRGYDRLEVRSATQETVSAFFVARADAIAKGRPCEIFFDTQLDRVSISSGGDTVLALDLRSRHGVDVSATRASMTFTAAGLGYGGANLSVILRRGSVADTVLVSREGRVRTRRPAR